VPKPGDGEWGGGLRLGGAHLAPEPFPSWHRDVLVQSGTQGLADLLLLKLCPGFGDGTLGKQLSWVIKPPSPPLPQDGDGQGRPHLTQHYSKGSSSFLGQDLLETKRVPISQCQPGVQPESGAPTQLPPQPHGMGHPQPHRCWRQVGGWWHPFPPPSTPLRPGHCSSFELETGAVGSCTPLSRPMPALSGLIRRRISRPCALSPDLINGPFISTLKESAIFCLLN